MGVLGCDGCRAGWVGAHLIGRAVRWVVAPDVEGVLAFASGLGVATVGIDIPIGLADTGPRPCDVAARARLGRAGSSVFPAPVRAVLKAATYPDACARSLAATAPPRAISRQTWNLVPRIRDADAWLDRLPPDCELVEVHPELSFRALDRAVIGSKHTAEGRAQRVDPLRRVLDVDRAMPSRPRRGVALDDALDACAVAWSAARFAAGRAEIVGDGSVDALGRPMRIVY
jgi:predicted RNase H-like nuclease